MAPGSTELKKSKVTMSISLIDFVVVLWCQIRENVAEGMGRVADAQPHAPCLLISGVGWGCQYYSRARAAQGKTLQEASQ